MSKIDFSSFGALTFDCYGTLIDWERGILNALQPILAPHGIDARDDELLESYAKHEMALEAGDYRPYREVLARALHRLSDEYAFRTSDQEATEFAQSVGIWPAFPDSARALRRLAGRFKLGVITNCDEDLFARSNKRLGVNFDWIVTAEKTRSYKPSLNNFTVAFDTIDVPRERILHVAQSLYHDHVPAKQLDMTTVWVDRRHDKPGFGATPEASATPDLTVPDMHTFADLAMANSPDPA